MILVPLCLIPLSLVPLQPGLAVPLLLLPVPIRSCPSFVCSTTTVGAGGAEPAGIPSHPTTSPRQSLLQPDTFVRIIVSPYTSLQNLHEMQLPASQAPSTPQITHIFAHISYTLRKS